MKTLDSTEASHTGIWLRTPFGADWFDTPDGDESWEDDASQPVGTGH